MPTHSWQSAFIQQKPQNWIVKENLDFKWNLPTFKYWQLILENKQKTQHLGQTESICRLSVRLWLLAWEVNANALAYNFKPSKTILKLLSEFQYLQLKITTINQQVYYTIL